jgi:signal transduction histidine kinase
MYFIVQSILLNDSKEKMIEKAALIRQQIQKTGEIPNIYPIVEVTKQSQSLVNSIKFNQISLNNKSEHENEIYLEFAEQVKIGNGFYTIKLRQRTFESEDLQLLLTIFFGFVLLSVFGIQFIISKKWTKTLWADFERNLIAIEKFSFNNHKQLDLFDTDIDEFDRLNSIIEQMTLKLQTDYESLKEFAENASHEIQTPLSIALLNLEELLQMELSEEMFRKVITSINALKRLSSLNQSLILLTKIENRQFLADSLISFNDLVTQKTEEFESLFETKKITVKYEFSGIFSVKLNAQLADILMNNLLSNALRHNEISGFIHIMISSEEFKICNSGAPNGLNNDNIFSRFTKKNSETFGLGLAIVQNICNTNKLEIQYIYDNTHCFGIRHVQ